MHKPMEVEAPVPRGPILPARGQIERYPLLAAVIALPAAILLTKEPLDRIDLVLSSLYVSLPLGALLVTVSYRAAARRSTWLRKQIGWSLSVAFILVPAAVAGLAVMLNARLDQGPEAAHSVSVLEKQTASSKHGADYTLTVQSWRSSEGTLDLQVSEDVYRRSAKGGSVTVRSKPGLFGYEWVYSFELPTSSPPKP